MVAVGRSRGRIGRDWMHWQQYNDDRVAGRRQRFW